MPVEESAGFTSELRRSVHDNRVTGYTVDCDGRSIVLHTVYEDVEPFEWTDITFTGVLAYLFRDDVLGANILLDVDEVPLAELVTSHEAAFDAGRGYSWPGRWNTSTAAVLTHFEEQQGRAWEISGSYGLDGWVVASSMKLDDGGGGR